MASPLGAVPAAALPYPSSLKPVGALPLFVISMRGIGHADQVTVGSLAGVLAREAPQVYTITGGLNDTASDAAAFWLQKFVNKYHVRVNTSFINDLPALLKHFSSQLDGFVAYDTATSPNAAITAGAASDGRVVVAQSSSTVSLLRDELGVPIVWNVSGLTPLAVFDAARKAGRLSKTMAAFQPDDGSKTPHLAAYAAFGRLATVEFPTGGSAASRAVMGALTRAPNQLTAALGWTSWDEFQYVSHLAAAGAWVHASDWSDDLTALANLPVHAGMRSVRPRFTSPLAVRAQPVQKAAHTVAFLMSDGDNRMPRTLETPPS